MPRENRENIMGSENPEDWVENPEGVLELKEDIAEKQKAELETREAEAKNLQQKEDQLLTNFKDYIHLREALDENLDKDSWKAATLAIAIAEKDPSSAKAAVEQLVSKNAFNKAGQVALSLGDTELMRMVVEKCPKNKVSEIADVAAALGDIEPTKNNLERWAKRDYYPSANEVGKMATLIVKKDPDFVKDLWTSRIFNPKDGNYYDTEAAANIAVALAQVDPDYAREIMEKDLSYKYGGRIAGDIAIALGDTDTAKKIAEQCLSGYSGDPRTAAKIAIACDDKDIAQKALKYAEKYGARTVGEIAMMFNDMDAVKKATEDCLDGREERIRKSQYDINSSDSGRNWEEAANKMMKFVAEKDSDYAKRAIEKYFLQEDKNGASTENRVSFSAAEEITVGLADREPIFAREIAQKFSDMGRHDISDRIVIEIFKKNVSRLELTSEEAAKLLEQGKDQTGLAVGWFLKPEELQQTLGQVDNENVRRNAQLGGMFNKQPEEYRRELSDIAFSSPDDPQFGRTLARCLVHFDYEQVSSIMLQKVKDAKDEKMIARYLKTLIEIENPKGRTIANDLFTNLELNPHLRRYLAKKLIAEKHWDPALGSTLKESVKENGEQQVDDTLVAMIKDLGLIPDKPAFEALEKPGLLQGTTLPERVNELKSLREEFSKLPLDQLKERLKDDRLRKVFYLVKGGEYRYTLINNYSYEKFSLVVGKILEQKVDEEKIKEFAKALQAANLPEEKRQFILQSLQDGHFPLKNPEKRSFAFDAAIELGSEYEIASQRLQEVWGRELHALGVANEEKDELPLGIDDALAKLEGKEIGGGKVKKAFEFIKQGEKQDFESIKKIAEACKKELTSALKQKAKQLKDKGATKEKIAELERLNISGIVHAFLSERLPNLKDSNILLEWESHLRETLSVLETGPVKGATKNKRLELTFLDKGRDFLRSVRFADGRQCCFNSGNYKPEGGLGAADWIARLHADPLSFIMDIKEEDSRIVSGFIFGRMGIDPETKRPIVMLNGIYSQEAGATMNNNILKLVEEKFADEIGSSSVVIASKYGGTLGKAPEGYEKVSNREIEAVRALESRDNRVYDDIGNTPNGSFKFEGYERQLS